MDRVGPLLSRYIPSALNNVPRAALSHVWGSVLSFSLCLGTPTVSPFKPFSHSISLLACFHPFPMPPFSAPPSLPMHICALTAHRLDLKSWIRYAFHYVIFLSLKSKPQVYCAMCLPQGRQTEQKSSWPSSCHTGSNLSLPSAEALWRTLGHRTLPQCCGQALLLILFCPKLQHAMA